MAKTKEQISEYQAYYYAKNRERIIKRVQEYTQRNRSKILERKKKYRETHKDEMASWRRENHQRLISYNKNWVEAKPYEKQKWYSYRSSAHQRGIEWSLSFEEFSALILGQCYYCNAVGGSVDRIDSKRDYTIGNCVSACRPCNRMKSDFGRDFFIQKCIEVAKRHGQ